MGELNRSQHEDLGGEWSTEPYFGGFTDLLNGLFLPDKAGQVAGYHYPSMINMVDGQARRLSGVTTVYVFKDSADTDAQFSVRAGVVADRGLTATYAGEIGLGDLAVGNNNIWLDLSALPTVSAGFGSAWPSIRHARLATINMPASGHWLPQHLTRMVGYQGIIPFNAGPHALRKDFGIADDGVIAIATVPANAVVGTARVLVTTAFDGTAPTLKIGDATVDDRLVLTTEVDLKTADTYTIPRLYKYTAQTAVQAVLDIDSSTVGEAIIILEQIS